MMMTNVDFLSKSQVEQQEFKEWLRGKLVAGEVVVEFEKVDGSMRTMTSTLNPLVVPPAPAPKVLAEGEVARVKKSNPDVCSVWDVNATAWRSFRYDKIKAVSV